MASPALDTRPRRRGKYAKNTSGRLNTHIKDHFPVMSIHKNMILIYSHICLISGNIVHWMLQLQIFCYHPVRRISHFGQFQGKSVFQFEVVGVSIWTSFRDGWVLSLWNRKGFFPELQKDEIPEKHIEHCFLFWTLHKHSTCHIFSLTAHAAWFIEAVDGATLFGLEKNLKVEH